MCFQLIFISPPSFGNSWIFKLLGCNFGVSFGLDTNHQDASCLSQGIKMTTLHIIRYLRAGGWGESVGVSAWKTHDKLGVASAYHAVMACESKWVSGDGIKNMQ